MALNNKTHGQGPVGGVLDAQLEEDGLIEHTDVLVGDERKEIVIRPAIDLNVGGHRGCPWRRRTTCRTSIYRHRLPVSTRAKPRS